MRREIVSIVTGWGNRFGAGHIQRMAALVDFLERKKNMRPFIINDMGADESPHPLPYMTLPYIQPGSSCLIRDMRDSSVEEMLRLKRYCRVITIDDCGPGRDFADLAIDLLPNLTHPLRSKKAFIFGYNFINSMQLIHSRSVKRTIDCAIYTGYNPPADTVDFILSLIPDNATCALLCGKKSFLFKEGTLSDLAIPYAEALLSSRVLISHFGITLYEGRAAGCRLISLNPTEYHSMLADKARDDLGLINLGTREGLDPVRARETIAAACLEIQADRIDPSLVLAHIEKRMELFYSKIAPYLADDWPVKK